MEYLELLFHGLLLWAIASLVAIALIVKLWNDIVLEANEDCRKAKARRTKIQPPELDGW